MENVSAQAAVLNKKSSAERNVDKYVIFSTKFGHIWSFFVFHWPKFLILSIWKWIVGRTNTFGGPAGRVFETPALNYA